MPHYTKPLKKIIGGLKKASKSHAKQARDLSKNELTEFVENLTQNQFAKIQEFFSTMPKLSHTVTLTHPKTKKKGKVVIEGMQSFF